MGKPTILPKMALGKIEEILALLGFVGKLILGHATKSRETKHCQRTGKAGNSAASRLDSTFEKLAVNILHVL